MIEDYESIIHKFSHNLDNRIDRLVHEFLMVRAGRANPKMLDKIVVDYYGTKTPLNQIANLSVPEAHMILISPWDISTVKEINKAILSSDLGITPVDDGRVIRLYFPSLTEERRKEIVKEVRKIAEEARIGVRNDRKDCLDIFKDREKAKEISKDELEGASSRVQKIVDKYNAEIDDICLKKEKEIMEV